MGEWLAQKWRNICGAVLAALLVIGLFGVVLVSTATHVPPQPPQLYPCQNDNHHTSAHKPKQNNEEGFWKRAALDPVAVATLILAVVTFLMTLAVIAQVGLARQEFNASHRPRIRIKHVWLRNETPYDGPLKISLVFTNVGDRAARINKSGLAIVVIDSAARLPPDIPFVEFRAHGSEPIGLGFTIESVIDTRRLITSDERISIISGGQLIYCVGFVEYLGTSGPTQIKRTSFARVLTVPEPGMRGRDFYRFRPLDPVDPDYEYED